MRQEKICTSNGIFSYFHHECGKVSKREKTPFFSSSQKHGSSTFWVYFPVTKTSSNWINGKVLLCSPFCFLSPENTRTWSFMIILLDVVQTFNVLRKWGDRAYFLLCILCIFTFLICRYRIHVAHVLPKLKFLDALPIRDEEYKESFHDGIVALTWKHLRKELVASSLIGNVSSLQTLHIFVQCN